MVRVLEGAESVQYALGELGEQVRGSLLRETNCQHIGPRPGPRVIGEGHDTVVTILKEVSRLRTQSPG
jgi:hypothetical protein